MKDENGNEIEIVETDGNLDENGNPIKADSVVPPVTDPNADLIEKVAARVSQTLQSFEGRKLKELKDDILSQVSTMLPSEAKPAIDASEDNALDPTEFFNNPMGVIDKMIEKRDSTRQQQISQKSQEYAKTAGSMLESDPIFQGEAGIALGNEVVEEISKLPVNPMLDARTQAELNVSKAKAIVLARRLSGDGKIVTALDKNKGSKPPAGSIQPGGGGGGKPRPSVNLAQDVRDRAKRMGMTDEEIDEGLTED